MSRTAQRMTLKQRLRRLEIKAKSKEPERCCVILAVGKSEAEIAEIEASLPKNERYIILDI